MERLFPYNWTGETSTRFKLGRILAYWYLVNAVGLFIYAAAICLAIKVVL